MSVFRENMTTTDFIGAVRAIAAAYAKEDVVEDLDAEDWGSALAPSDVVAVCELAERAIGERDQACALLEQVADRMKEALESSQGKTIGWRCGWCGTIVGTVADPDCGVDAGKAHSLACEKNPLVVELNRLRDLMDTPSAQYDVETYNNGRGERIAVQIGGERFVFTEVSAAELGAVLLRSVMAVREARKDNQQETGDGSR